MMMMMMMMNDDADDDADDDDDDNADDDDETHVDNVDDNKLTLCTKRGVLASRNSRANRESVIQLQCIITGLVTIDDHNGDDVDHDDEGNLEPTENH